MQKNKHKGLITTTILLFIANTFFSCSLYKITSNGKTMLGSNYDAYYLTAKIWFENAKNKNEYGAVYTGGRFDGINGYAPQSGMNEFGLAFTQAAVQSKEPIVLQKTPILSRTNYLKDILHKCKTIKEVKNYITQYGYCDFSSVFLYTDKSGNYLIVEPDTMYFGSESKYVLSNFCPSTIKDLNTIKMVRYRNGVTFLKNKIDSTIAFCKALSDTMSVCREKMGTGTLLTSIWDVKNGITYLYFYHNFNHLVQFKLKEELKKGDHVLDIPTLFPANFEFEKLVSFKTPQNSIIIDLFLRFCVILFSFSGLCFLIFFFRKRKTENFYSKKILLSIMSFILVYYILVLVKNESIFYFPAPYEDYTFSMLNIASYIPFLLLFIIIPLISLNFKIRRVNTWSLFSKILLVTNNVTYLILLGLFYYWGLLIL